ncbi:MAG: hypothetical protein NZ874_08250 [Fimbriimonadales bacterium]|nr:hypothetical protein [Fimbriimonadales bacterium]
MRFARAFSEVASLGAIVGVGADAPLGVLVASASRRRPCVARASSPCSVARTVVSVRGGLDKTAQATGAWARRPSHWSLASAGRRRYIVRLLKQSLRDCLISASNFEIVPFQQEAQDARTGAVPAPRQCI